MLRMDQSELSIPCEDVTKSGLSRAHLHRMVLTLSLILVLPHPDADIEPLSFAECRHLFIVIRSSRAGRLNTYFQVLSVW